MNAELEAIKDAWDKNTGNGRDEDGTRAMCDAYVEAKAQARIPGLRKGMLSA